MSVADELEKLRKLHEKGALTDEEYARAKDAVLSNPSSIGPLFDDEYAPPAARQGAGRWYLRSWLLVPVVLITLAVLFATLVLPRFLQSRENLQRYRQQMERRQHSNREGTCPLPTPPIRLIACTTNWGSSG